MKKITLSLIALVALGGVAFGQEAKGPGEAIDARPEILIGFAERSLDEQRSAAREPEADAVVAALMADDARYGGHTDEGRFLARWALANRDENPELARDAFSRRSSEFLTVSVFASDRAELEAMLATTTRQNAGTLAHSWAIRNDQRSAIPGLMQMITGRGVTDPHYQRWLRGHLASLPIAEAIELLETELRALLSRAPEMRGRTEAIRELRAQLIILRDLAGD